MINYISNWKYILSRKKQNTVFLIISDDTSLIKKIVESNVSVFSEFYIICSQPTEDLSYMRNAVLINSSDLKDIIGEVDFTFCDNEYPSIKEYSLSCGSYYTDDKNELNTYLNKEKPTTLERIENWEKAKNIIDNL